MPIFRTIFLLNSGSSIKRFYYKDTFDNYRLEASMTYFYDEAQRLKSYAKEFGDYSKVLVEDLDEAKGRNFNFIKFKFLTYKFCSRDLVSVFNQIFFTPTLAK